MAELNETELVVWPLLRAKEGLSKVDLLRLLFVSDEHKEHIEDTDSKGIGCFGASEKGCCMPSIGFEIVLTIVGSGVGDWTRSWVITA